MLIKMLDTAMKPIAHLLEYKFLHPLGVNTTMKLARKYNCLKFGRYYEFRKNQYLHHFDELIQENGLPSTPTKEIKDGWALDTSGTLPHLKQLLADAEEIIKERGGVKRTSIGRPWTQEISVDDLLFKYPSILDFATSSDVLSVVCNYLGYLPVFSTALPHGVRFVESWAKFDDNPDGPLRASQLFHLDFHDSPVLYVIVTLRDVSMENGPFCFLSASISQKATNLLKNYHSIRGGHRVTDKEMYSVVPESELKKLCYPAGTVLFFDNSKCFHYGSRNAVKPRYLLIYAYLSPCKTNLSDLYMSRETYPVRDNDSRLRKMVLKREYME